MLQTMNVRRALGTGLTLAVTALLALGTFALMATGYTGDPSTDGAQAQTDILAFLGTIVSAVAPVLIAVAGGVVGIFILAWGIRTVFHKVRGFANF